MQTNTTTAGTAQVVSSTGALPLAAAAPVYSDEQVTAFVAALEKPFEAGVIKWRVTNMTPDRRRGQMIAYADPRAYTDRLNALFTVRGWTREYTVQVIQNFERKGGGSTGILISGKIVVTCRLTIAGLGSHSGLGEEWADNDNAGTAAEAQAFKRACACFGLGRYLYDLGGNWVDLDERRQPLAKPRLPEWALPKTRCTTTTGNGKAQAGTNGHAPRQHPVPVDVPALKARVKSLCEQVGFGLARSITRGVAATENWEKVADAAILTALSTKLEDTLRGVERLRAATAVVGQAHYSQICQQMNLAGDTLDDIPDRRALRCLVEALENKASATQSCTAGQTASAGEPDPQTTAGVTDGHRNGHSNAPPERPAPEPVGIL